VEWVADIVTHELEFGWKLLREIEIASLAGKQIIEPDDIIAPPEESLRKVRAQEAGSAEYQMPRHSGK
jgi:hypothetical protein